MLENLDVDGYTIKADISVRPGSDYSIILMHGAQNDMDFQLIKDIFDMLMHKFTVLRFNFSFAGKGPALLDTSNDEKSRREIRACIRRLGLRNIVLIGKSYSSALALSLVSEKGLGIKKVIVLGLVMHEKNMPQKIYPISYIGKSTSQISFIIGDSDPYCNIEQFMKFLPNCPLYIIKNAGHSYEIPGSGEYPKKNWEVVKKLVAEIIEGRK